MSESGLSVITVDIEEEDKPALNALGIRLALLQGVYDCTYLEVFEAVKEKYSHRRVFVDSEEVKDDD